MKKLIKEFKSFAIKGNAIDLAVAVVIGGAFGKIITSLVNDIIMPLAGMLLGGNNLTYIKFSVGNATVQVGYFLQSIVNFLIIAVSMFLVIKFLNELKNISYKEKASTSDDETLEPAAPTEIELLIEIRDSLKNKKN